MQNEHRNLKARCSPSPAAILHARGLYSHPIRRPHRSPMNSNPSALSLTTNSSSPPQRNATVSRQSYWSADHWKRTSPLLDSKSSCQSRETTTWSPRVTVAGPKGQISHRLAPSGEVEKHRCSRSAAAAFRNSGPRAEEGKTTEKERHAISQRTVPSTASTIVSEYSKTHRHVNGGTGVCAGVTGPLMLWRFETRVSVFCDWNKHYHSSLGA